ncbi:MAG: O-antigen ligase family protein [Planctomycetota bacterium]
MATVALTDKEVFQPRIVPLDDRHGWGFALLVVTTGTLFLRPADLVPELDKLPIYQCMIIACLIVSARTILKQLAKIQLNDQPITACLLLLLIAVGVSHLVHGFVWGARMSMMEFSKTIAFYLLVTGLLNTPRRLYLFTKFLTLAITFVAALALLDRFELLDISALEPIQDRGVGENAGMLDRIRGTGIFNDPNDFGLILVTGLILSVAFLTRRRIGWPRHLWLVPAVVLFVVLVMTHSRGAFLSLACAIPAVFAYRKGLRIGIASLIILPLLTVVMSARMSDFNSIHDGTGQTRIQIWSDSLFIFRQYPLFGLGEGLLVEELGVVAHNSFIHCFAELGFFGGTAFVGCFLAAGLGLWALRIAPTEIRRIASMKRDSNDIAHLRVFLFAALTAYAGGMMALSRQFITPTYLVLGLAGAAQSIQGVTETVQRQQDKRWSINNRFVLTATATSSASLIVFYLAVKILIRI